MRLGRLQTAGIRLFSIALCVVGASCGVAGQNERPVQAGGTANSAEVARIGADLRAAVIGGRVEPLLKYAWHPAEASDARYAGGQWSADGEVTLPELERLLSDRRSVLYCMLFDEICLRAYLGAHPEWKDHPARQRSIREFLMMVPAAEQRVVFSQVYVRPGARLPQLQNAEEFAAEGGRWGKEFVATQLVRTAYGWRYFGGVFAFPTSRD